MNRNDEITRASLSAEKFIRDTGLIEGDEAMTSRAARSSVTITVTDEMVERGTKAIYLRMNAHPGAESAYAALTEPIRDGYRSYARTVLDAACTTEDETE